MPAPKKGPRLGGGPGNQRSILANQASELFVHGRIRTTETKAKTLRPYAEKLITKAKSGTLHDRRQVLAKLRDRDVVSYLFEDVAPRFAERPGGYTRILKLGPRQSDATSMAIIELVEQGAGLGEEFVEEAKAQRSRGLMGRLRQRFGGGDEPAAEEPAPEPAEEDLPAAVEEAQEQTPEIAEEEPEEGPLEEDVPEQTPAEEPSAPDEPAAGAPVDEVDDEPDAGAASGKPSD